MNRMSRVRAPPGAKKKRPFFFPSSSSSFLPGKKKNGGGGGGVGVAERGKKSTRGGVRTRDVLRVKQTS